MNFKQLVPLPVKRVYRSVRRVCRSAPGEIRKHVPWLLDPPPPGAARFRSLRGVRPIRRNFGWDTGGVTVDRYYIERFLRRWSGEIRGRVLEIGDPTYTRRFGTGVQSSDVLHVKPGNPRASLVADLTSGEGLPSNFFDCIILTHTLAFIYEVRRAMATLHRILAPGGVILASSVGISQIARYDMEEWGEYWHFTSLSLRRLFAEYFPEDRVTVEPHGNVLIAVALLHGLIASEFKPEELDYFDQDYEVAINVRAVKPSN